MPMIKIRHCIPGEARERKSELAALLSRLTANILHKDPEVTSVLVESASPSDWFIAGSPMDEQKLATFYIEVSITEGTNSRDETSEYVRRVFLELERLIGPVHPASYVLVHLVPGDTYGYGGMTQSLRWAAAALPPAVATSL